MPAKPTLKTAILNLMADAGDPSSQFEYGPLPWPAARFKEFSGCSSLTQVSKCLRRMEADGLVVSEVIEWDTWNAIKRDHAPRKTRCYWPVEGLAQAKADAKRWNDGRADRASRALKTMLG